MSSMTAGCTFGISLTINTGAGAGAAAGTGHDKVFQDDSPIPVTAPNVLQYEDGLCPYSDEKEVVVEEKDYANQSIWRTTATSEDLLDGEQDSARSIMTADSAAAKGQQIEQAAKFQGPGTSTLPCLRAWRITKNAVKNASSSTSKYLATCTPDSPNDISNEFGWSMISRAEFEKLPLTIQRKVRALPLSLYFQIAPFPKDCTSCPFVSLVSLAISAALPRLVSYYLRSQRGVREVSIRARHSETRRS